jgi:hypothetical protein
MNGAQSGHDRRIRNVGWLLSPGPPDPDEPQTSCASTRATSSPTRFHRPTSSSWATSCTTGASSRSSNCSARHTARCPWRRADRLREPHRRRPQCQHIRPAAQRRHAPGHQRRLRVPRHPVPRLDVPRRLRRQLRPAGGRTGLDSRRPQIAAKPNRTRPRLTRRLKERGQPPEPAGDPSICERQICRAPRTDLTPLPRDSPARDGALRIRGCARPRVGWMVSVEWHWHEHHRRSSRRDRPMG